MWLILQDPSAKYTLIDVRNPDEIQRSGLIPTAKSLPRKFHCTLELNFLVPSLVANTEDSDEVLPEDKEEKLIFYCQVGELIHSLMI